MPGQARNAVDRPPSAFVAALAFAVFAGAAGNVRADSAVMLGVGQVSHWITAGSATNPNSSLVELLLAPFPSGAICPDPCPLPYPDIALPALATSTLNFDFPGAGFGILYLTQIAPGTPVQSFPVVHVRISDQTKPWRAVDVPVIPLSRLMTANPSSLYFPGVRLEPIAPGYASYSNLFLGNVQRPDAITGEDLPLNLELFDREGDLVASRTLTIPYGQMVVINPVTYLGRNNGVIFQGQVRVTRMSGDALLWGVLYSIDENDAVTASVGTNLSP